MIEKNIEDKKMTFHNSINELLDSFRAAVAALSWTQFSAEDAKERFKTFQYLILLPCSVIENFEVKIDKNILELIEADGIGTEILKKETPLYTTTLINFYRIFTIAVKEVIWNEPAFSGLLNEPELQFLRHIRNASAHNNLFFWGTNKNRKIPKEIVWRNKKIIASLEDTKLYMDFMKPGDLFILLEDISSLIKRKVKK